MAQWAPVLEGNLLGSTSMSTKVHARIPYMGVRVAAFLVCIFESLAMGQTAPQEDAQAIAMIKKAAFKKFKDADGRVTSITFVGNIGVDIGSIDFSVFPHLESLTVHNFSTKKKKISLAPLLRLPSGLVALYIYDTDIDEKQLGQLLQKQKLLRMLWLSRTTISDSSLVRIGKLQDLHTLHLDATRITDKGLRSLIDLKYLFSLDLRNTDVSDSGLAEIKKLSNLGSLNLSGTKVTDAGILQLADIEWLQSVNVSKTKATENGKKALKELLPRLEFAK
jgi:internalin A